MTTKEDGSPTIVAASAPRPWPRPFSKEVWHVEEEPDGTGRIWMSNKGRILWKAPKVEDAVTFEERTLPTESSGIEQLARDLDTPADAQWRKFYHRLDIEVESGEEVRDFPSAPSAPTEIEGVDSDEEAADSPRAQCGFAGTQEMRKSEAVVNTVVSEGPRLNQEKSMSGECCVTHQETLQSTAQGHVYQANPVSAIEEEAKSNAAPFPSKKESDNEECLTQKDVESPEGESARQVKSTDVLEMSDAERERLMVMPLKFDDVDSMVSAPPKLLRAPSFAASSTFSSSASSTSKSQ